MVLSSYLIDRTDEIFRDISFVHIALKYKESRAENYFVLTRRIPAPGMISPAATFTFLIPLACSIPSFMPWAFSKLFPAATHERIRFLATP